MPDDEPKYQPSASQMFGVGEHNTLNFFLNLSEADRAQLVGQLRQAGVTREEFETLLRLVDETRKSLAALEQRLQGVSVQGDATAGGDIVGRDKIIFEFRGEDRDALRRAIPAVKDQPLLREALYSALRVTEPDVTPVDYAALARRLREPRQRGDAQISPLDRAEREEPLYVPLAMKFSRHRRVSAQSPFEFERDFGDILEAVQTPQAGPGSEPYPALLLLGAPGGGKSTALRHLALDRFNRLRDNAGGLLPLFVSLGEYQDATLSALRHYRVDEPDIPLTPVNFLRAHWLAWFGDDGFVRALDDGRLWLILDGLNEIPDRDNRVLDWKGFFDRKAGRFHSPNRAIVACRRADYGNWLDLPYLDLEALDVDRIRDFVGQRLEPLGQEAAEDVMRRLEDDEELLEVVSNPFWLTMLTGYVEEFGGRLPEGRTTLIDWFVDDWLKYTEPGRADLPALSPEDIEALKRAIEPFAYWLLDRSDNAPVAWEDAENCCGAWGGRSKADALRRAEAASLLVREPAGVKFYHQLILEYFAGLGLARRFRRGESLAERWRIPWRNWSFVHSEWQRLSGPPTTRWEEAVVFAVARPEVDLDAFTRAVLAEHPPLAARCLLESGKEAPRELRQAVIDRLLALVERRDPMLETIPEWSARLSLRIAAGHALGKLGDGRILGGQSLVTMNGKEIAFIEPSWCPVPAGPFTMGSNTSPYPDERPEHTCDVIESDYAIGMFPVTNAEYECFVQAGGYSEPGWWRTDAAKRWLAEGTVPGEDWLYLVRYFRENPGRLDELVAENRYQPDRAEAYRFLISKTDDEVVALLSEEYRKQPRDRPAHWSSRDLNGRNQPVVGVCWHEAMAYCAWLTQVLRAAGRIKATQEVTLPNEPEWEKAALQIPNPKLQSQTASAYPWGDEFSPERANTLEGRVLTTTPVGVYDNASGCGAFDMSGNVWEWTRSRWGDNAQTPKFGYPYSKDLEERERLDADDLRILRGGSWGDGASSARRVYRYWSTPDNRYLNAGFRCVLRSL